MLEALSRALFDRQVGSLDRRFVERRGWTVVTAQYPVLDVIFNHPTRPPLRLRMTCVEWDDLPPSIELLTADGAYIPPSLPADHPYSYVFTGGSSIFNSGPHPNTNRPFICMRGSLEFHTHSSHLQESWDNYRRVSGNDLLGLLEQLWQVWKRAAR